MYAELPALLRRVDAHRMRELLLDFANIASPPGDTAVAAQWYTGCLRACGAVEAQVVEDWPHAPSVVAGIPGVRRSPTLELNGHLDTQVLAPARPTYADGRVYGRGVAWNKGGLIAAAEAVRVLSGAGPLPGGGLLVVAHSRGEEPAGDAHDLTWLIGRGFVGDATVITTGDHALAPVASLGLGIFRATFTLPGAAQHERRLISRTEGRAPRTTIDAAEGLCALLHRRRNALAWQADPVTGAESIFVSRISGGERYNREPPCCLVEGTWRWQPERSSWDVYAELESLAARVAARCGVRAEVTLTPLRDGFRLTPEERVVRSLCDAYRTVVGHELPLGGSTFAGDAPVFVHTGHVAAISHGLDSQTAQTADESVAVDELVRLAKVYICLALEYLGGASSAAARREGQHEEYLQQAAAVSITGTDTGQPVAEGCRH